MALPASAELYRVPADFSSIQEAIVAADSGDVIVVDPNTYYENINFLGKNLTLRSLDPNDPDIVSQTIIDGSQPVDPDKGSVVTFDSGEDRNAVLSGFTLRGGTGSWIVVYWHFQGYFWNRCGGGVICYNQSSPTIRKNVFRNNNTGQGGGVYYYNYSHPAILENTFVNNTAVSEHGFTPPDTEYPSNDHGDGGAIVGYHYCNGIISKNLIRDNHADAYGGGIHIRQWSDGIISQNQFFNNDSALGAGIHITYTSSPRITQNHIENNVAGALGGGGIYIYYLSNPLIERNLIIRNISSNGAGVAVKFSSAPVIRSNIIISNKEGAGIVSTSSAPAIYHNTIIFNTPQSYSGGIYCNGGSSVKIINNIIAFNDGGYGVNVKANSTAVVKYNNLWKNGLGNYGPDYPDQTGISGNISVNPGFIYESDRFVRLSNSSPCIGAGDPNYILAEGETDYDGHPRKLKLRTDLGADEVYPVSNDSSGKQYETIQQAINEAQNGHVITVVPDRFDESIHLMGKNITLRSTDPYDWNVVGRTVIHGRQQDSPVVTFVGTETADCHLAGFTITGSAHTDPGGGILANQALAVISHCWITDNQAQQGAGVYGLRGRIQNCRISYNQAQSDGGGVGNSGAEVMNCLIFGNSANRGGGLYSCNGYLSNNTIVENKAVLSGGGFHSCQGTITNSIIWQNTAAQAPNLANGSDPNYSCIEGGHQGVGNIADNPGFVDPNNDNYHLNLFSHCRDRGNNSAIIAELIDYDNEPRIFSVDPNLSPIVDLGADEVVTNSSDFSGDGVVGVYDLSLFLTQWLDEGSFLSADLNEDHRVDFEDYLLFSEQWLWRAHYLP